MFTTIKALALLTFKRRRSILEESSNKYKQNKETNLMQDKIKKTTTKVAANDKVATCWLFCRSLGRTVLILGSAALSAYLLVKYNDRIINGLGVAFGLAALIMLVNSTYLAEAKKASRK